MLRENKIMTMQPPRKKNQKKEKKFKIKLNRILFLVRELLNAK
jgi:hypothetical protein